MADAKSIETYNIYYTFNTASEMTQIKYPSGRIVRQSFDAIGRLCEIAPTTTGCGTAASPFATGYGYNTAFQLTGFNFGNGVATNLGNPLACVAEFGDTHSLAAVTVHNTAFQLTGFNFGNGVAATIGYSTDRLSKWRGYKIEYN